MGDSRNSHCQLKIVNITFWAQTAQAAVAAIVRRFFQELNKQHLIPF